MRVRLIEYRPRPSANEIPLSLAQRTHTKVKKSKANYSGNSGASHQYHRPPTGIRKSPRRKYVT